ncbi:c-type cytochrome [Deinococcus radiopugnans]|uniref:Cytochrome c n=1 Tax=Deinococcus radiopugnans ATCC 19172 TaxID=585398 RepID=A0A5C4XG52_9DEIO|nr:cytochrome c [Deinococcus radiopugnans]MBB6018872.1 mono/diheme cytochrome c family protein [Deinococcus radiopugnans ATCC 19172]TNM62485.1 cytochrome c [Deinococcus radiopugnans ATCC 19172]
MNKILLALTAGLLGPALAATPAYTKAQADAGAKVYKAQCAACHGAKLNNGGAPKLAGTDFLKKWSQNTLDDFFFIESHTMPQTNPGGLKESEYLNALAYILQENGFKPGKDALAVKNLKSYTFKK